uniref:DNA primase large subunit C-terminal domain-containing protein n=1 Tax=Populus trichocarpa TaxID=3694 RepID=B9IJG3_POPTR
MLLSFQFSLSPHYPPCFCICYSARVSKGVGLKLDDALAFWKAEFSQMVGAERFDKEYAYSIRHNYGREGKRTDYTPYSCQEIFSSTPGVGDHHGCPYRHP